MHLNLIVVIVLMIAYESCHVMNILINCYRYEKSTESKIRWAMKAYVRWMRCRNNQVEHGLIPADRKVPSPDDLILMTKNDISKIICMFIMEVRDGSGREYNRDTLYDVIVMVQAFFKQNRRPFKFFDDDEFYELKNTLDNRMRDLTKQGKVAPREKAEPISIDEEERMWSSGTLGEDNPEKLINTVLYLLGVHFGLRAADEHKSLKIDCQFKVLYDESVGLKYIYYRELSSKCNQGGISDRNIPPKTGRAYQNVVNSDRCIVRLFEKYVSVRPDHDPRCSKDFYLRPLAVPNGDVWFSCQPRGIHTLQKVVKNMSVKAGIIGRRSNHSCRAASATRLYEQGCDEQLICEKTGHRSVAVRSYKRTSSKQLSEMSNMLYGNNEKKPKQEPSSTVSVAPLSQSEVVQEQNNKENISSEQPTSSTQSLELTKGIILNINLNISK